MLLQTLHSEEKYTHLLGHHIVPLTLNFINRIAEITIPHRVQNRVCILRLEPVESHPLILYNICEKNAMVHTVLKAFLRSGID